MVWAKLGPSIVIPFVQKTDAYLALGNNVTAKGKMEAAVWDKLKAMTYIKGSDRTRYQSLIDDLRSQYTRGNDQYPETVDRAMTLLSKHRPDNKGGGSNQKRKEEKGGPTSFLQAEDGKKKCYCCGSSDHILPDCPEKGRKPKEEWVKPSYWRRKYVTEHEQHHQRGNGGESESESGGGLGWSGVQIKSADDLTGALHMFSKTGNWELLEGILLDSGSTVDIFGNKKMVKNIQDDPKPTKVGTNGGMMAITKKATLHNYGEVGFKPDVIANILGLCNVVKKFRVQFDSKFANCFYVHTPHGILKFECDSRGLYKYIPGPKGIKPTADLKKMEDEMHATHMHVHVSGCKQETHLQSVEKNKEGFTKQQVERANKARSVYHMVFAPSMRAFRSLTRQGFIQDFPITHEDMRNAEAIYGKDVSTLKGRSRRPTPPAIDEEWIEIPRDITRFNRRVTLFIDVMYVNQVIMLTSVDKPIVFRGVVPIPNRSHEVLFDALAKIRAKYHRADFVVHVIRCDGEFRPMMTKVEEKMQVIMNYANPGDHVPQAERNNQVIKERFRVHYHRMPYKKIPKIMIQYLAMQVTHTMNYFPAKNGLSRHYSPYMILNERTVNFKQVCVCEFGAYVQANHHTTNTPAPRTISAIYLRPATNMQEGHEVLDLQTRRVVTRLRVTEIPITKQGIALVESWAAEEGFTSLKFYDRNRRELDEVEIVHDGDQIAGVEGQYIEEIDLDYEDEDEQEDVRLTGVDPVDEDEVEKTSTMT